METIRISEEAKQRMEAFQLPDYKEIPDIGLFLEQTTKFVSEYLAPLEGISITGSMISNYVKMHLIANPVKKQYYRDQIAEIIFIALVKSVLSLEEAEKMLQMARERYTTEAAYRYFCESFCRVLRQGFDLQELPAEKDPLSGEQELLQKVILAVVYKIYLNEVFKEV